MAEDQQLVFPVTTVDAPVGVSRSDKELGAFYTDESVAGFLTSWAVRQPDDTVLDPCFGGGVFLRSACRRLESLGAAAGAQVWGIEVDPAAYYETSGELASNCGVPLDHLTCADFFGAVSDGLGPFTCVVGNPPFIRYQRFKGRPRQRALALAKRAGVHLSQLSSSWAPFVVCAASLLRPAGRLAMVVPAELTHAAYAQPVLRYLLRNFGHVTILTFRQPLFASLSEDTALLLAERKGEASGKLVVQDLAGAHSLAGLAGAALGEGAGACALDSVAVGEGRERVVACFLTASEKALYGALRTQPWVRPLGAIADVGIGYVTGANDFFHVSEHVARSYGIPAHCLRPAVRRGRDLTGAQYTREDWEVARERGDRCLLLSLAADTDLADGLEAYLSLGRARGVDRAYKCRVRRPWYSVPHVYVGDALLSYMSGQAARLVQNVVGAVAPNSLHLVRLRAEAAGLGAEVPVLWQTSLCRLSCEIEGHSLGGGMLKLEPTEAERVWVPTPPLPPSVAASLAQEVDGLLRAGRAAEAEEVADRHILVGAVGLTLRECQVLRSAASRLRTRRYERKRRR